MEVHIVTPEYFAGFFDGEGSVLIYQRRRGARGRFQPYNLRATVTNTNREVLVVFKNAFGGGVYRHHCSSAPNRSPAWVWTVSCQKAAVFLRCIEPSLIVKKQEAMIGIAMQDAIDNFGGRYQRRQLTADEIAKRDGFRVSLLALRRPAGTRRDNA